jgi:hypothetical protein
MPTALHEVFQSLQEKARGTGEEANMIICSKSPGAVP